MVGERRVGGELLRGCIDLRRANIKCWSGMHITEVYESESRERDVTCNPPGMLYQIQVPGTSVLQSSSVPMLLALSQPLGFQSDRLRNRICQRRCFQTPVEEFLPSLGCVDGVGSPEDGSVPDRLVGFFDVDGAFDGPTLDQILSVGFMSDLFADLAEGLVR